MARISGVTLPANKRIEIALTSIYGIGLFASKNILKIAKISPDIRTKDLTPDQINLLHGVIEKQHKVEGDLKREVMMNVKRLKEIGCYRGTRHAKNLPCRGQKTKTNSRTVRGNIRKTALSGRKPAAGKT